MSDLRDPRNPLGISRGDRVLYDTFCHPRGFIRTHRGTVVRLHGRIASNDLYAYLRLEDGSHLSVVIDRLYKVPPVGSEAWLAVECMVHGIASLPASL